MCATEFASIKKCGDDVEAQLPSAPDAPLAETGGAPLAGAPARTLPRRPATANTLSGGDVRRGADVSLSATQLPGATMRRPPRPRSAGSCGAGAADYMGDGGTGGQRLPVAHDSARSSFRKGRSSSQCSLASTALPSTATSRPASRESSRTRRGSRGPGAAADLEPTLSRCQTFGETFHAMSSRGGAARRVNPMTFSSSRRPQGLVPEKPPPERAASLSSIRGGGPTLHEAVMAYSHRAQRHSYMTFSCSRTRDFDSLSKTARPFRLQTAKVSKTGTAQL